MSNNILYVGSDDSIEHLIVDSLKIEKSYYSIKSLQVAYSFLEIHHCDIVIVDEGIVDKLQLGPKEVLLIEQIYERAISQNSNILFFYLTSTSSNKKCIIEKKNSSTFIFNREQLSPSKICFAVELCRDQSYRTILAREIVPFVSYPVSFYHTNDNKQAAVKIAKNTQITNALKEQLHKEGIKHLFVLGSEYQTFLKYHRVNSDHRFIIAQEIDNLKNHYKDFISQMIDDSGRGNSSRGIHLKDQAEKIVDDLVSIIHKFPDLHECMDELPFPKATMLAHGINLAIYSICIGPSLFPQNWRELAIASLVHDMGLAKMSFHLLTKNKGQFTQHEFIEYRGHVDATIQMLAEKNFAMTPLMREFILSHHENFDGTGFPHGRFGDDGNLKIHIMSILDSLDGIRTVKSLSEPLPLQEAWDKIQVMQTSSLLGQKFSPAVLQIVGKLIMRKIQLKAS